MKEVLDSLFELLGSHSAVADQLQYSDRNLRKIRKKIEGGQALDPRVELWIMTKYSLLKNNASRRAYTK